MDDAHHTTIFNTHCTATLLQIEPMNQEAETLANMAEYGVASAIYFAMLETQACETAQRVTAMDSAR